MTCMRPQERQKPKRKEAIFEGHATLPDSDRNLVDLATDEKINTYIIINFSKIIDLDRE